MEPVGKLILHLHDRHEGYENSTLTRTDAKYLYGQPDYTIHQVNNYQTELVDTLELLNEHGSEQLHQTY